MKIVNMHAAKTNLSELIARVLAGEEIVIARSGTPVAKWCRSRRRAASRVRRVRRGRLSVTNAFFEPLPDDELDAWRK